MALNTRSLLLAATRAAARVPMEASGAPKPAGVFHHHAEHAGISAVRTDEGAVGESVVGFLRIAAALKNERQRLVPGGLAGFEHPLDTRADILPDLGPHDPGRFSQRPGMFLTQCGAGVGIVVKNREFRTPGPFISANSLCMGTRLRVPNSAAAEHLLRRWSPGHRAKPLQ
jgi:hypothetical protein